MSSSRSTADADPPPSIGTYALLPPEWRAPFSSSADLGYPDFMTQRNGTGQDEEKMPDSVIRNGYVSNWGVSQGSESFSIHGLLLKDFATPAGLSHVSDTMAAVLAAREQAASSLGDHTFKIPARFTLHESKKLSFVADLANPSVPLHRLTKSIPHGYKGLDLLEMLWKNGVSLERGIWFAKVIGANEMQPPRGKPPPPPDQYCLDWTTALVSWLKKQLADIALPSAPRAGFNIKQTFKSILSDEKSRARWIAKWEYSTAIVRISFEQSLLSNWAFFSFLIHQISAANLAQLGFVVQLVDEYLGHVVESGILTRALIDGLSHRMSESYTTAGGDALGDLRRAIARVLQSIFLDHPALFVSPRMFTQHSAVFASIFADDAAITLPPSMVQDPSAVSIMREMEATWLAIKKRNEGVLARTRSGGGWSPRRQAMSDINLLDSISSSSDMGQVSASFFAALPSSGAPQPSSTGAGLFVIKVDILLSWAITYAQFGPHRTYAVATLLTHWRGRNPSKNPLSLQEIIFNWIDSSQVTRKEENVEAVAEVLGELVRVGLVSYPMLLQRLTSRGFTDVETSEDHEHQLRMLRSIPLHVSNVSLLNQRNAVLYGGSASLSMADEEALDRSRASLEVKDAFPELASSQAPSPPYDQSAVRPPLSAFLRASRWTQVLVGRELFSSIPFSSVPISSSTFARLLDTFEQIKDYSTIYDILLAIIESPIQSALMVPVISSFHRYADVWTAMDVRRPFAESLFERHLDLRDSSISPSKELLDVLAAAAESGLLPEDDAMIVAIDLESFKKTLRAGTSATAPLFSPIPEVLSLCLDARTSPEDLATTLWYRHGSSDDWAAAAWESAFLGLHQVVRAGSDAAMVSLQVERHAAFLRGVHSRLSTGLDIHVARWLQAQPKASSILFAEGLETSTISLLLSLVLSDCISTSTIVEHIALPSWRTAAIHLRSPNSSRDSLPSSLSRSLRSINHLVDQVLLPQRLHPGSESSSPFDLAQSQRLQTQSVSCYEDPLFLKIVAHLSFLIVLEIALPAEDSLAQSSTSLRERLSVQPKFRTAAFRHPNSVKESFLRPALLQIKDGEDVMLDARLIDALKVIVSDGAPIDPTRSPTAYDWRKVVTRLSPWRWSRSVLELQLSLKQIAIRLSAPETRVEAVILLENLTRTVFERSLSSDEADLICDALGAVETTRIERFAGAGASRLADTLSTFSLASTSAKPAFLILRDNIAHTLQVLSACLPQGPALSGAVAEPSLQDRLLEKILALLQETHTELLRSYRAAKDGDLPSSVALSVAQLRSLVYLLTRCLHVTLGFSRVGMFNLWSTNGRATIEEFTLVLVRLAWMHGGVDTLEAGFFDVLIDTAWAFIDEVPKDAQRFVHDAVRALDAQGTSRRHPFLSPSLRTRLALLFPYSAPDRLVAGLAIASSSADPPSSWTPAQSRPWEWLDCIEPSVPSPSHRDAYLPNQTTKNISSIPLSMFRIETSKDRVPTSFAPKAPASTKTAAKTAGDGDPIENDAHNFESEVAYSDGLEVPGPFVKDWSSSLVRSISRLSTCDGTNSSGDLAHPAAHNSSSATVAAAAAASPAASSSSTLSVTVPLPRATQKRKASASSSSTTTAAETRTRVASSNTTITIDDDDDDIEFVAPPAKKTTASRAAKAPATSGGGSGGGARTGGKAPAKAPKGGGKGGGKQGKKKGG